MVERSRSCVCSETDWQGVPLLSRIAPHFHFHRSTLAAKLSHITEKGPKEGQLRHEHATDCVAADWRACAGAAFRQGKALTHASDALAAERRRIQGVAVEKDYLFGRAQGPKRAC